MVPPITLAPTSLVTGIDSPVTIDSSTALRPSSDVAVDRHLLARAHAQAVADLHGVELDLLARVPSGLIRRAVFGARSSSARMAPLVGLAGAQLQHLPEQHQHGDDRRRLEVDGDRAVMAAERRREDAGRERRDHAVDPGHAGAHGDQREHVEVAGHERLPAAHEERPAGPEHDRRRQQRAGSSSRSAGRCRWLRPGQMPAHLQRDHRHASAPGRSRTGASCRRARGSGPVSAVASTGSSAMPQIGQEPGPDLPDLGMHRAGVDRALRHGLGLPARLPARGTSRARPRTSTGSPPSRSSTACPRTGPGAWSSCGSTIIPQTGSFTFPASAAGSCDGDDGVRHGRHDHDGARALVAVLSGGSGYRSWPFSACASEEMGSLGLPTMGRSSVPIRVVRAGDARRNPRSAEEDLEEAFRPGIPNPSSGLDQARDVREPGCLGGPERVVGRERSVFPIHGRKHAERPHPGIEGRGEHVRLARIGCSHSAMATDQGVDEGLDPGAHEGPVDRLVRLRERANALERAAHGSRKRDPRPAAPRR